MQKSTQSMDKLNRDSKDIREKVIQKEKLDFEIRQEIDEQKWTKDIMDLKYVMAFIYHKLVIT
jgi:hypothetical protein